MPSFSPAAGPNSMIAASSWPNSSDPARRQPPACWLLRRPITRRGWRCSARTIPHPTSQPATRSAPTVLRSRSTSRPAASASWTTWPPTTSAGPSTPAPSRDRSSGAWSWPWGRCWARRSSTRAAGRSTRPCSTMRCRGQPTFPTCGRCWWRVPRRLGPTTPRASASCPSIRWRPRWPTQCTTRLGSGCATCPSRRTRCSRPWTSVTAGRCESAPSGDGLRDGG